MEGKVLGFRFGFGVWGLGHVMAFSQYVYRWVCEIVRRGNVYGTTTCEKWYGLHCTISMRPIYVYIM